MGCQQTDCLVFWEHYTIREIPEGKTVEALAEELISVSHIRCSLNTCKRILDAVKADHTREKDYQDSRDIIIRGIVKDS